MKTQTTQPVRPLCLRIKEAKNEICASITHSAQKHNLSYSILELIVSDALYQIQLGARDEAEEATTVHNRQLAELQKNSEQEVKTNG